MSIYTKKVPAQTYKKLLKAQKIKINEVLPGFPEDGRIEHLESKLYHIKTPNGLDYYATIYEGDENVQVYRLFKWTLYKTKIAWDETKDHWSLDKPPKNAEKIIELPSKIKVPDGSKILPTRHSVIVKLPDGETAILNEKTIATKYGSFDIDLIYAVDCRIDEFIKLAKMM